MWAICPVLVVLDCCGVLLDRLRFALDQVSIKLREICCCDAVAKWTIGSQNVHNVARYISQVVAHSLTK